MRKTSFFFLFLLLFFPFQKSIVAQNCSTLNFQEVADIPSTCNEMVMTMIHDQLDRPYLYVANKEAGLKIYDISTLSNPVFVTSVPISLLGSLDVMNLVQEGNYIYLSLGNHFTNPQNGGMAIIDISNPASPIVSDYYTDVTYANGGGIVKVEGNYAYFGAMKSGLIVFDISNKNDIQFVSQFIPDINYPVNNPNPDLYNARGMVVKNSIVYLCYDAGGLRIINCENKSAPVETGRYVNPVMYQPQNHPKAYNNIALDGDFAYIAVDYCGMEVLDISDTSNITLHGWWNPYGCPNSNWFTSPSHSNEIHLSENCKQAFLSTGKSDLMVVDIANPAQPDSCNFYGGVNNNIGTWGVRMYQDQIYLSYVCAFIPFSSNWTGVKILNYSPCSTPSTVDEIDQNRVSFFPNPSQSEVNIFGLDEKFSHRLVIYNAMGYKVKTIHVNQNEQAKLAVNDLTNGVYFLVDNDGINQALGKFIINR